MNPTLLSRKIYPQQIFQLTKRISYFLFFFLILGISNVNAKSSSDISIYECLKTDSHFNVYIRLIDDLNYTNIFTSYINKTLFVANDSAFNEFFKDNQWGVHKYEQLTFAQKKYLLNFSFYNNPYTLSIFANLIDGYGLVDGLAMRKSTSLSVIDSVPYLIGDQLPASKYWSSKRTTGVHLLSDNSNMTTVFFTQSFIDKNSITDEDLRIIAGIDSRSYNDVYIFNDKVIKRDIECTNGYIHVLKSVLIPPKNMAQYIFDNVNGDASQTTKIFSKLLERFSAPYFDAANTVNYKQFQQFHPELPVIDSIFVKGYFSPYSHVCGNSLNVFDPYNMIINSDLYLPFDPGWNSYVKAVNGSTLQSDMATMFVPSDAAMTEYFNSGILKVFGSWDNVPDLYVTPIIRNCMRASLIESVPSKFSKMVDAQNYRLPVEKSDLVKAYMGVNGVVYVTNKVYLPVEYNTAYSPVYFGNNTKIMNWVISSYGGDIPIFKCLLMANKANYSLFIPTDEALTKYIDPVAFSKDVPATLKYWYNSSVSPATVYATIYKYDKTSGVVGDSIGMITDNSFLLNRLVDILNSHIVVGDVQSGKGYYMTRGNVPMKIESSGSSMTVQEGGNIKLNEKANVTNIFNQANGNTYFIDKPLQSPLQSVYKVLSQTDAFKEFFNLLNNSPVGHEIFKPLKTTSPTLEGIDYNVKFFNAFNYTVYVPTNEAIQKAIADTLILPWQTINNLPTTTGAQKAYQNYEINKLERFLRYHFQDNSVFVNNQSINKVYQTATIKTNDVSTGFGTFKNKFYKIAVSGTDGNLTLTAESGKIAHVLTTNGLYNIMTRDFVFNYNSAYFKNIDGTGAKTTIFTTSRIETSSTAVIHQIDNVLTFE